MLSIPMNNSLNFYLSYKNWLELEKTRNCYYKHSDGDIFFFQFHIEIGLKIKIRWSVTMKSILNRYFREHFQRKKNLLVELLILELNVLRYFFQPYFVPPIKSSPI